MVTDWFKLSSFTSKVKRPEYISISSEAGVESTVRYYAENFNVVHVFVGNSSPKVLVKDNRIVVGNIFEDDEEVDPVFNEVGKVCTDVWWVTLVDKEFLLKTEIEKYGVTKGTGNVTQYCKENDIVEVTIDPGTYHLYFDNDETTFAEKFAAKGIDLSGITIPRFMLSRDELVLENKVENISLAKTPELT